MVCLSDVSHPDRAASQREFWLAFSVEKDTKMSAMNTTAIVEGFAQSVPADETRIKLKMARLIKSTVEASSVVVAAKVSLGNDPYAVLAGGAPPAKLDMGIDHSQTLDERVNAAAALLFEAYD